MALDGLAQLVGVLVGGVITLAATVITSGRQAKQASASREAEAEAKRDDIQRDVLFALQEALQVFVRNIGRELRDKESSGDITDDADRETMESRTRLQVQADRLRPHALREQAVQFVRMCDEAALTFEQRDDVMKKLRPLMVAYTELRDAIRDELQKYQ